jgi:hypothetical protein
MALLLGVQQVKRSDYNELLSTEKGYHTYKQLLIFSAYLFKLEISLTYNEYTE